MANSFERFEKFFNVSRKKDKSLRDKLAARKMLEAASLDTDSDVEEGSLFPSPSYLKPTASRMQPRIPTYERKNEDVSPTPEKTRSHSLPNVHDQLKRRSSSSFAVEIERMPRSYDSSRVPSYVPNDQPTCSSSPQSSRFRFPEDSLFRTATDATGSSRYSGSQGTSEDDTPVRTPKAEPEDRKLLDWSPEHISFLLSPIRIPSMDGKVGLGINEDDSESMILMPSPSFSVAKEPPSIPQPPKAQRHEERPRTSARRASSPQSRTAEAPEWKFSLFPKQYSVLQAPATSLHPPPSSESQDELQEAPIDPTKSLAALEVSNELILPSTPDMDLFTELTCVGGSQDEKFPRETWGFRLDDPFSGSPEPKSSPVLRSRIWRNHSAGAFSLTAEDDGALKEPTITDIYALSDEDIAEIRAPTPAPWDPPPPPPPPKDEPLRVKTRFAPKAPIDTRQAATINVTSGEITPPETPTDPQFLIPMPASHSAGELGAIMAAGIAKKYNFDLVYLVSLWPSGGGNHLDPSICTPSSSPQRTALGGSICTNKKSKITGRYLAAFGLNEVTEPFRIQTKYLLKSLRNQGWNEFEDSASQICRGWACSFNSDFVPTGTFGTDIISLNRMKNRGIVFGAYTKQENEASMLFSQSLEKQQLQEKLYADVKLLVHALVERDS
ncbi:hypothetical protein BX600DRAFT_508137 [Xylariales sp. PMI_506]|nr:hypothetical protein BX600DRAFT_508137 [Xylariales sp. PMI_506]